MEKANIHENEKVRVVDVNNGSRLETYVIAVERNSGIICLNSATARLVQKGDSVIIMSYCILDVDEIDVYKPVILFLDQENNIISIKSQEKPGVTIL